MEDGQVFKSSAGNEIKFVADYRQDVIGGKRGTVIPTSHDNFAGPPSSKVGNIDIQKDINAPFFDATDSEGRFITSEQPDEQVTNVQKQQPNENQEQPLKPTAAPPTATKVFLYYGGMKIPQYFQEVVLGRDYIVLISDKNYPDKAEFETGTELKISIAENSDIYTCRSMGISFGIDCSNHFCDILFLVD